MSKKILYTIGVIILGITAYSFVSFWMDPNPSTIKIMAIDYATGTASVGFDVIDSVVKQPIKGIRVRIFLKNDDDTREEHMALVAEKYTDDNGRVLFTNLVPNTFNVENNKSNSYVVLANDELGQKDCDAICTKYVMNGIRDIRLGQPGHYDSRDIELFQIPKSSIPQPVDGQKHYLYADYNFDGYSDRAEPISCGTTKNCLYTIELYDPISKTYSMFPDNSNAMVEPTQQTSDVTFSTYNPVVNGKEQIVCSDLSSGLFEHFLVIYKHTQNYFLPIKGVEIDGDLSNSDKMTVIKYSYADNIEKHESAISMSTDQLDTVLKCSLN